MSRQDSIVCELVLAAVTLTAAPAGAQTWPTKPVRIVTAAAGGLANVVVDRALQSNSGSDARERRPPATVAANVHSLA